MIDVHGPRDMQEDGLLAGRYVFGGIDGLLDFLRNHLETVGNLEEMTECGFGMIPVDDPRQHLVVEDICGDMHIIPRAFFEDVVSGKVDIRNLDDFDIIIPNIIKDWLSHIDSLGG